MSERLQTSQKERKPDIMCLRVKDDYITFEVVS